MLLGGGTILAVALALWRARHLWKIGERDKAKVVLAAVLLILGGWAVYGAFYFQAGFPAGESLNNSDWLSFLGGYLGFAGSLIMAWLVYLQDTRLKELTLEEYAAAFSIRIKALEMAADTEEDRKQIFSYLKQGQEKYVSYFKHDAFPLGKERQEAKENCVPKIFFSLKNAGKLPVKKLRFKEIRIEPYEAVQEKGSADPIAESCGYRFAEKGGANILNGRHELLPEGALNICLVIHSIPEKLPFSAFRLTFRFELGAKVMEQTVLFYIEVKGKDKITISDGEVVF